MAARAAGLLLSRSAPALRSGRRRLCTSPRVGPLPTEGVAAPSTAAEAVKEHVTAVPAAVKEHVRSMWESFAELLVEHPIKTNAVTSGVLCAAGDGLAQAFEWRLEVTSPEKDSYNYLRTARMAVFGTLIGGPVLAMWYRALHAFGETISVSYAPMLGGRLASLAERVPAMSWLADLHVEKSTPVAPAKILMSKVVLDTMMFQAPFLNLYFAVMGALEGLPLSEIYDKTKASFHRAWALSFLVWAPVQSVNLYFVPMHFQPVVVAGVNVGWKTTLSLLNHYHDYGSPRRFDSEGQPTQSDATSGASAAARDAAEVAWQVERTQLRARIKQLKDENKALHLQLGQLHAAFASSVSSFRDHDEARGGGAISDEMVHDEAGRRHAKGHGTPEG